MEEFIKRILRKEDLVFDKITRSSSGFTNFVFFVDDKYVVKVINSENNPKQLHKEIGIYKNVFLDEMPKFVASGSLDGREYLIIEKIKGKSLYKVWHKLDFDERKKVVQQIADILKKFHSQPYKYLEDEFIINNWQENWTSEFKEKIALLKEMGYDLCNLENFVDNNLNQLFLEQRNCLVYNDAHFDNFIYDSGKIKIIDFDRVVACSKDYELLIIKQMLDSPIKFASEEDEPNVVDEDYKEVYSQLKMFYPDLFTFERLDDRVFVYQFIYNLSQAFEYNNDNRIREELERFNERFEAELK